MVAKTHLSTDLSTCATMFMSWDDSVFAVGAFTSCWVIEYTLKWCLRLASTGTAVSKPLKDILMEDKNRTTISRLLMSTIVMGASTWPFFHDLILLQCGLAMRALVPRSRLVEPVLVGHMSKMVSNLATGDILYTLASCALTA